MTKLEKYLFLAIAVALLTWLQYDIDRRSSFMLRLMYVKLDQEIEHTEINQNKLMRQQLCSTLYSLYKYVIQK